MMNDDLGRRLARLREEWPVGSIVSEVGARIEAESPRRGRRRDRWLAGAAASAAGLLGVLTLAWLLVASRPVPLLAAVRRDIERAGSAHLTFFARGADGEELRGDTWYVKGRGVRVEEPGLVIVEDAATRWSWRTDADDPVVIRQPARRFFDHQLRTMFGPNGPDDVGWPRERARRLDRDVDGRPCRAYTLTPPAGGLPRGLGLRVRAWLDDRDRFRQIDVEERRGDGEWRRRHEIHVDYDPPTAPDETAFRPPPGARVIGPAEAFHGLHPLDRALHRVEKGGLILAVHDVRPLEGREGVYVVSSVRGTPKFLAEHPPRHPPLKAIATQMMTNRNYDDAYDIIGLAGEARDGVEFAWWIVFPRRFDKLRDGRPEYLAEGTAPRPAGSPARLDDLAGKLRVPLHAIHLHESIQDRIVSTWAEVPLPADRPPATIEAVAARARRDLMQMGGVDSGYRLRGVATDVEPGSLSLRPPSPTSPDAVTDADFAAAVRRGMDRRRELDAIGDEESPPRASRRP